MQYSENYERNLPHYLPSGSSFFITSCLKGSLPKDIILQLKEDLSKVQNRIHEDYADGGNLRNLELANAQKRHFGHLDKHLDNYS